MERSGADVRGLRRERRLGIAFGVDIVSGLFVTACFSDNTIAELNVMRMSDLLS